MKKLITVAVVATMLAAGAAQAREQLIIVGSSTVFPFATKVAEALGRTGKFKTPVIESTGSGGGLKLFCNGIGTNEPDITNASRAIKQKEKDKCASNGVTPVEYMIGFDGIVVANDKSGHLFDFTKGDIFNAVAEQVLIDGKWVKNPYKKWNEINPKHPADRIDIMVPPPTSGTRDAFIELVLHSYCKKELGMSKKEYKAKCTNFRTDGPVVPMGENDNLLIQKARDDNKRLAVFGYSFLDQNMDQVQGSIINGVEPTADTIADGSYTVSRPLYFYLKKEHLGFIPGLQEYADLFMSPKMIGKDGQLVDDGLISLEK